MKRVLSWLAGLCLLTGGAADLENEFVSLSFDALGRVVSLKEKPSGRELVKSPRPFALVRDDAGRSHPATAFSRDGNRLSYGFDGLEGRVALDVTPFAGGWTFAIADCTVRETKFLTLGDLAVACGRDVGSYANMISDDRSAVCLRAYDIPLAMGCDRGSMRLWTTASRADGIVGLRFGLSAGPWGRIRWMLQRMTEAAGVPKNEWGGAWSVGCPALRGSYLQPRMKHAALDRWIELAERGGFGTIHLRQWMKGLGHYTPNPELYPGGWDDIFDISRRIHAAGLRSGIHTLTACISPDDPWATGPDNRDLLAWNAYTLAADLPADATELVVNEEPTKDHDVIFSYFGNGNVLRIGTELVSYTGVVRERPFRFTGLTRGAYGSAVAAHRAGDEVAYLQQRYRAFYPRPDSPLSDKLAEHLAKFVNEGGFDQVYLDGSEGMMSRIGTDTMRRKIFGAFGKSAVVESSCEGAHNWWYHSRVGAWDGPNYDFKACFDLHVATTARSRKVNLLEPQMGWWYFRKPTPQARGQFLDDVEYFAAHNTAIDSAMSFMDVDVNDGPLSLYRENAVTVLGWYERFRLARAFEPSVQRAYGRQGDEFRLRQDADGTWKSHPVAFADRVVAVPSGGSSSWKVRSPDARRLDVRIEPLYSNNAFDDPKAMKVFDPAAESAVASAPGVKASCAKVETVHGTAVRLTAQNESAEIRASWASAAQEHLPRLGPLGRRGIGFWMKGDGSGAVLNFQIKVAREHGGTMADFMIPVDFTGWKFIDTSIRERTVAAAEKYVWPEGRTGYRKYLSELHMLQFAETAVRLNGIPQGRRCEVEVGEIRMMHVHDAAFASAELSVNGAREKVPFAMTSGQFAVRDASSWTLYTGDGDPLRRVKAVGAMALKAGDNDLSVTFAADGPETLRARVCTFAVGAGVPALANPPDGYEAALSAWYEPTKGFDSIEPLRMRPGWKAAVEGVLTGPIVNPVLTVGTKRLSFPSLAKGEERRFKMPGTFSGVVPVTLAGAAAAARLSLVKRYQDANVVATLENDKVVLSFDRKGCLKSVKESVSGRELAGTVPVPFVAVSVPGCANLGAERLEAKDDGRTLVFTIPGGRGTVTVGVEPFAGGWTFRVKDWNVPEATALVLGRFRHSADLLKYRGAKANAASDDRSAVCVRGYGLRDRMLVGGGELYVMTPAKAAGTMAVGFAAGPKAGFTKQLQAMTVAAGVVHTPAGGAWALEGEGARASYLNANVTENSLDDWIDFTERGGFGVLHFRERWYACRGHYPVNTNDWPSGLSGLRRAVEKVHAAGLLAGMHTLTGCIDPKDPWIASEENTNLLAWTSYTLAEPLPVGATELTVAEPPVRKPHHDTVFTYSGNGNAIRIGTEIVQYSGVSYEKPYRFTGLTRGAFGTKAADHASGDRADWLQQRYLAFYPDPDSQLALKLVEAISNVYNTCKFDQIYCDGLEGMFSAYGEAWMRHRIIGACAADGRPVLNEDSCTGSDQSWWFHSRLGAWDDTHWAPKRFHDRHIAQMKRQQVREGNFLELQMGWWQPTCSPAYMRPHMVDDIEYYAAKNTGLDASMSIAGIDVSKKTMSFHHARQMTVLGWYEHARRARAFDPAVVKLFGREGAEFRLRQDATGEWTVSPLVEERHKFSSADPSVWRPTLKSDRVALRVHALYAGRPYEDADALTWLSSKDIPNFKFRTANVQVGLSVEAGRDAQYGDVMKVRASNAGASSRGAWAMAENAFEPFRDLKGFRVIRARIRGDGSGAVLNFQLTKPRVHGDAFSEHYVKLDFTGWKEVEMPVRERDAEDYDKYVWPYNGYAEVFHRWLNFLQIGAFNLIVNEIPAGGKVDVEIADVRLVNQVASRSGGRALAVNGVRHEIPFEMATGSFAELEDGVWTHYADNGEPLARVRETEPVRWKRGVNEISYEGPSAGPGVASRAEVDLFVLDEPRSAFMARPTKGWGKHLSYEAVEPVVFEPAKGFAELPPVRMRPGESASVEAWVYGPCKPCVIALGDVSADVPALEAGARRLVRFAGRHVGSLPVSVRTDDPAVRLRIEFAKRY